MSHSVAITFAILALAVGWSLAFAEDASALGHGRAGCGHAADYGCAAYAEADCSGGHYAGFREWRPLRRLLGFERRAARRAARYARYAHAYGCAGAPAASCAGTEYYPEPPEHETDVAPCPHCDGAGVCPAPAAPAAPAT